jgi:hypothetical protein
LRVFSLERDPERYLRKPGPSSGPRGCTISGALVLTGTTGAVDERGGCDGFEGRSGLNSFSFLGSGAGFVSF